MVYRAFPKALKAARGAMRAKELARRLNREASNISRWETGKTLPETATVSEIEQVLGITDGRLMTARQTDYDRAQWEKTAVRETLSADGEEIELSEDARAALAGARILTEEIADRMAELARLLARLERLK